MLPHRKVSVSIAVSPGNCRDSYGSGASITDSHPLTFDNDRYTGNPL